MPLGPLHKAARGHHRSGGVQPATFQSWPGPRFPCPRTASSSHPAGRPGAPGDGAEQGLERAEKQGDRSPRAHGRRCHRDKPLKSGSAGRGLPWFRHQLPGDLEGPTSRRWSRCSEERNRRSRPLAALSRIGDSDAQAVRVAKKVGETIHTAQAPGPGRRLGAAADCWAPHGPCRVTHKAADPSDSGAAGAIGRKVPGQGRHCREF